MALNLSKGANAPLSQGLRKVCLGLGWNARATAGDAFDLDASAFLVSSGGKVRGDHDFIFYNQPQSEGGAVVYGGDNRTGAGDGDDETIQIDLGSVPADVAKVVAVVTIHEAASRRQNFGMVSDAYIRVVDLGSNSEILRYDLGEDFSIEAGVIFGELYRHDGGWKFRAVGQGFQGGLEALAKHFGVNI
jgi:tellurium resistance protein TerD